MSTPDGSAAPDKSQNSSSQDASTSSSANAITPKGRKVIVSTPEAKRLLLFRTPKRHWARMKQWYSDVKALTYPGNHRDCWLYPMPYKKKYQGTIRKTFAHTDEKVSYKAGLPFGIVALLIRYQLTREQKKNIVKGWELSHLCGNWTCCNWRHFTIEDHSTNVNRNRCFRHRQRCQHTPRCMIYKKKPLSELTPSPPASQESSQDASEAPATPFRQPPN
ncbi:hypothetical protein W97_06858 [Coniosporium apollinis CBS 100218]|uniref:Zinc-binding loop region of homing endonuclease domain-containing protein n=1 Tax=Coniosporium apollinis (strain CBS 100218) TaxID=1168221 RepID=R7Z0I8_CONA1|nr:uncharacterized protein W97_06858 [Coniosporium apollinis CBS 100218]EON67715.1 hypothetical protein W97_06858 [Coniosporium apollinis CBS 100218]